MEFIRKTSRRILDFVLSPRKEIAKLRAKKFIEQHPVEPMPKNLAKHILTIPELNALNVDVILTHVMTNPGFANWHRKVTGKINPLNDAGDFAQIVKIAKEIRDDLMHASLPGTIAGNEIHGSKVRYLNLLIQAAEKKLKK